jgi:alpha-L-rhamnosidase
MEDKDSPPVEHVRIRNCIYRRGGGVLTLGSEATLVRDVVVEDCRIIGNVRIATLKLRHDTPQHYEGITFRNIMAETMGGAIVSVQPWSQYANLMGEAPPQSVVRNVSFVGIKGHYTAFGTIRPNPGQTEISDILFEDLDVVLEQEKLAASGVKGLRFENVRVNGRVQQSG